MSRILLYFIPEKNDKNNFKNSMCSCEEKAVLHYSNCCTNEQFWNIILHEKTHEIAGKLIASLPGCMKQIFEMKEKQFVVFKYLGVETVH
jgi:hypothetical protein